MNGAGAQTAFAVTNLNDSGAGSLRQAIIDANANAGSDEITFAAGLSGEIVLTSGAVAITESVMISGPGATKLSVAGDGATAVVPVTAAVDVIIDGLTIKGGGGGGTNSGGVYVNNAGANVTIRNAIVSGNTGFYGGGVSVYSGQLTIEDSRITGNTATSGGGIATATSTTLRRVEISENTSTAAGGGVFLNSGTLVIDSSTISANTAQTNGGVHRFTAGAALTVDHSTIVNNVSTTASAGGVGGSGTWTLHHSIISGNTTPDVDGTITASWSVITNSAASVTDLGGTQLGVDPQLEALAFNGGLTRSHFPTPTSPVIDAGDPAFASPPTTDQRGARRVARPAASTGTERIDIGAVEVAPMDDTGRTDEDTALTVADPGVLANDNRTFTVQVVDQPAHGQLVLNPAGGYTYTPFKDYHGTDAFTYRLVGADAPQYLNTVTIEIASVYDPFQLSNDTSQLVNAGSPVRLDVLANDSGEDLVILSVTQGRLGVVSTDGSAVLYTPNQGATGTDTFGYVATDGTTQASATITLTVAAQPIATTTTVPVPSTTTTPPPVLLLPRTGSNAPGLAALAAGVIALGAVLARAGRRRQA
ncbi:MAG: Ig-like domain-containing protein [Acidimicrobiia bacterium]